jgi:hypothetical protein
VLTLLSLLASLAFFGVSWILAYYAPQRTMSFFGLVAICAVECIVFSYYTVSMLRLSTISPTWNAHRMMLPLFCLFLSLLAAVVASWMLPCGVLLDLYDQLHLLGTAQGVSVIIVLVVLLVKLVTAVILTLVHVKWAKRMTRGRGADQFFIEMTESSPSVMGSTPHQPCHCPSCQRY